MRTTLSKTAALSISGVVIAGLGLALFAAVPANANANSSAATNAHSSSAAASLPKEAAELSKHTLTDDEATARSAGRKTANKKFLAYAGKHGYDFRISKDGQLLLPPTGIDDSAVLGLLNGAEKELGINSADVMIIGSFGMDAHISTAAPSLSPDAGAKQ